MSKRLIWKLLLAAPLSFTTSAICSHTYSSFAAGTKIGLAPADTASGPRGKPNRGEIDPPGAIFSNGEPASAGGGSTPGAICEPGPGCGNVSINGAPNVGPIISGRGPALSGNGMIGTISIGAAGCTHTCGSGSMKIGFGWLQSSCIGAIMY